MKHSNALRGRDGFCLRSDLLGPCPFARNQLGCRQGSDLSVRALQRHCLGRAPGPRSSRRPAANAAIKGAVLSLERSLRCSHIRKIIPPMLTPVHAHRLIGSAACALRREKDPAAEADAGTGRSVESDRRPACSFSCRSGGAAADSYQPAGGEVGAGALPPWFCSGATLSGVACRDAFDKGANIKKARRPRKTSAITTTAQLAIRAVPRRS